VSSSRDDAVVAVPTDQELARMLLRGLGALIALLLASGVASAAGRLGAEEGPLTAEDPAVALAGPRAVGPLTGTPIAPYVEDRGNRLAEARGVHAAVVSFAGYKTAAGARQLLGDVGAMRWLVALPGGRPAEARPDEDLLGFAKAQREEAAQEKKALEALLPSVEDAEFARQYKADIDRLAAFLARPVANDQIVYAAVVVAHADRLRSLSRRADVRMVDLAKGADPPPLGAGFGLRPEETVRVGEPANRPA
jgi:hypothetical protein